MKSLINHLKGHTEMKKYYRKILSFSLLFAFICIAFSCLLMKSRIGNKQIKEIAQSEASLNTLFYFLSDEDETINLNTNSSVLSPAIIYDNFSILAISIQKQFSFQFNADETVHGIPIFICLKQLRI
jgi:hypothetical protein